MRTLLVSPTLIFGMAALGVASSEPAAPILIGVAKTDITPNYAVRLSGYAVRPAEFDGVAQKIWAKALAIGSDEGDGPAVLLSVENCGMTQEIRTSVAKRLKKRAGVNDQRLVICVTHTHSAPCLTNWAPFLFGMDIPTEHQQQIDRYTHELTDKLVEVSLDALTRRKEGHLFWSRGEVGFAVNRRNIQSGTLSGFGVQEGGPVDHRLSMLIARDIHGELIAIVADYACHCTTVDGDFNQICGDWAGYAQEYIENDNPGAVALITIGCGADANPKSRGGIDVCQQHGRSLADEVSRLLRGPLEPVRATPECQFMTIDLPFDKLPTRDQWQERAKQRGPRGYHARKYLEQLDRGEKIPTTLSYPVATWTFGDDLAMVFLGGEVVVDYAIRFSEEFDGNRLWVTAYSNWVPCYIPSQRILREGGYEAEGAMTFYARPTRLAPSVEQLIVDTVQKLLPPRFYSKKKQANFPPPKSPEESLAAIVSPGISVELVAAEPLVVDPVAFDWGPDGQLWVVEMRDYPNGMGWRREGDPLGEPGGRIRLLDDIDGDGRYDKATVFLDRLSFPTGVKVWRDGILIAAAPEIIYAEDTDGDDRADKREVWYRGFGEGNQQHRVNGLRWGLDNWLHVANSDRGGMIQSLKTGDEVDVSGRDLRIRPDEGLLAATSGHTQYGRCRDDWGNWFGGNNSQPMWHYVLDEHYLRRNPHFAPPDVKKQVSIAPGAATVFPVSRTLARFNDLDRANRFTSACSQIIYRDELIRSGDQSQQMQSFVCEPVHNLVHREVVTRDGVTFTSRRPEHETESEFLASKDNWFRPVMVRTGPDGALWIADMYRFVTEHPKWIPKDWQGKLDIRAGDGRGRMYRVFPADAQPRPMPRLDRLDTAGLVAALESPNGWQRDMAQQMLIWHAGKEAIKPLQLLAQFGNRPQARLHALCTLDGLKSLQPQVIARALVDEHPDVRRQAVRLSESRFGERIEMTDELKATFAANGIQGTAGTVGELFLISSPVLIRTDRFTLLQCAYSMGEFKDAQPVAQLAKLAERWHDDPYLFAAIMSSIGKQNIREMIAELLGNDSRNDSGSDSRSCPPAADLIEAMLGQTAAFGDEKLVEHVLEELWKSSRTEPKLWHLSALVGLLDMLDRRKSFELNEAQRRLIVPLMEHARARIDDKSATDDERLVAVRLVGRPKFAGEKDAEALTRLLSPQTAPQIQSAAVAAIARIGAGREANRLLAGWQSHSPKIRSQILETLLSRKTWTDQLLDAVESEKIAASQIDAGRRQRLLSHEGDVIRRRAEKVFAGPATADRQQMIEAYTGALRLAGDASRGNQVFAKRCAVCHRLGDVGYAVGPDIAALTDKSPQAMLVAILDPNRAVEDKYLNYSVITRDGRQFTGILANETGNSITLRGNEGKETVVLRTDIDELFSSGKSQMPDGMEKEMSKQDMADMIAYVRSTGPPPRSFPGNRPKVVRPEENGTLRLLATTCKIYGPRLVFEQKYQNLGWWVREQDRAVWSLKVRQAGAYRVTLDYACAQDSAGSKYILTVAGQSLRGTVESTGIWDNYVQQEIGTILLPAGAAELVVRSDGSIKAELIDLRGVMLEPLSRSTATLEEP